MTILRRNVLTANRRSNNLKEHLEGFLSVNGVGPTELPDPDSQMSGIMSQLLEFQYLKTKEITETAFQIRRIPEIKASFKHMPMLNMIANALGYRNFNELSAAAIGEDKVVLNKNFGTGLVNSHVTASAEHEEKVRGFWNLCSEVFIYVKSTEITFNRPAGSGRIDDQLEWYAMYVQPIVDEAGIKVSSPEVSGLNWTPLVFSMALAAKYSRCLSRGLWKKAFKSIPEVTTVGESRAIAMELMARPLKYLSELDKRN
ncbi:hypothetical protein D9M68_18960 [compost metagenome]